MPKFWVNQFWRAGLVLMLLAPALSVQPFLAMEIKLKSSIVGDLLCVLHLHLLYLHLLHALRVSHHSEADR